MTDKLYKLQKTCLQCTKKKHTIACKLVFVLFWSIKDYLIRKRLQAGTDKHFLVENISFILYQYCECGRLSDFFLRRKKKNNIVQLGPIQQFFKYWITSGRVFNGELSAEQIWIISIESVYPIYYIQVHYSKIPQYHEKKRQPPL